MTYCLFFDRKPDESDARSLDCDIWEGTDRFLSKLLRRVGCATIGEKFWFLRPRRASSTDDMVHEIFDSIEHGSPLNYSNLLFKFVSAGLREPSVTFGIIELVERNLEADPLFVVRRERRDAVSLCKLIAEKFAGNTTVEFIVSARSLDGK